jgi:hypothetical protein
MQSGRRKLRMDKLRANCVEIGTHQHSVTLHKTAFIFIDHEGVEFDEEEIYCDMCVAPYVRKLYDLGIETVEACCGHGDTGYIMVKKEYRDNMTELGYVEYEDKQWTGNHERYSCFDIIINE